MRTTLKSAAPKITLLFGICAGVLFVFAIRQDDIGRHKQCIFTLEHVLKSNGTELTKMAVLDVINDLYAVDKVVVADNAIYLHRMEFYINDDKYSHGDIGVLRK